MGLGAALIGAALIGGAASVYSSNQAARVDRSAAKQAERQQQKVAEQAREDQRRQNQNQADISGILQNNIDGSLSGGSTLLTGAGGVSNDQLSLGAGNKLG
mgnify:CR=1 FL=1